MCIHIVKLLMNKQKHRNTSNTFHKIFGVTELFFNVPLVDSRRSKYKLCYLLKRDAKETEKETQEDKVASVLTFIMYVQRCVNMFCEIRFFPFCTYVSYWNEFDPTRDEGIIRMLDHDALIWELSLEVWIRLRTGCNIRSPALIFSFRSLLCVIIVRAFRLEEERREQKKRKTMRPLRC